MTRKILQPLGLGLLLPRPLSSGMRSVLLQASVVLALLVVTPFIRWNTADAARPKTLVELEVHDPGLVVKNLTENFWGPYDVEPGDTFESISTKFFGKPDYAKALADALGVPPVYIPPPGSIAYIPARGLAFLFSPDGAKSQKHTVEQFLAALPNGTKLIYQWAYGSPAMTLVDGKWIMTKFDVAGMLIERADGKPPTLELKFPLRPIRSIILEGQTLEGVSIQTKDTSTPD
jgi:hypothetical protein